jgi:2-dehydro-3-deoxyphosphooctonate aldolase (KDO 8-P synthase)
MSWSFRRSPFLVAGPCVVEEADIMTRVGEELARLSARLDLPVCFKASFDKANRAGLGAARGPGLDAGLRALERVRTATGLALLTDVHHVEQVRAAADVVDALQIPAFLCRQTDLLIAAGQAGRPVNVKKGQWMSPEDMAGAVAKVVSGGCSDVAVTERGTFFGYGDLVVDMRNFGRLRQATGVPVVFDATHAVQRPGQGAAGASGGDRAHLPALLRAAAAAGADGFFLETHPDPARALSDSESQWPLDQLGAVLEQALEVWYAVQSGRGSSERASTRPSARR